MINFMASPTQGWFHRLAWVNFLVISDLFCLGIFELTTTSTVLLVILFLIALVATAGSNSPK